MAALVLRGTLADNFSFVIAWLIDRTLTPLAEVFFRKKEKIVSINMSAFKPASGAASETLHQLAYRGDGETVCARLCIGEGSGGKDGVVGKVISLSNVLRSVDDDGRTAVHWACSGGHASLVSKLLEALEKEHRGGAQEIVRMCDETGWTPLHSAASAGHASVVQVLLTYGADAAAKNDYGATPLHYNKGIAEIVQALVAVLADGRLANASDKTQSTPFHRAVAAGSRAACEALLAAYPGPDEDMLDASDRIGNTSLHIACELKHEELALWLAQRGANKELRNSDGKLASEL